ncbi:hypothetical protein PIIN_09065 [Serendipita indica DSM 11827]|uniref:Mediator of RNA polymerase II transcription subunit 10 n=1 Tax=Serendipita indica (strain DSM 11827) TaxID=1109443 RepID=G4TUT7_SERID|nr:hypothetical protein PIIN_09065 [Serendipita indica DSM 11827]
MQPTHIERAFSQVPPLNTQALGQMAGPNDLAYDAHSPQSTGSPEPPSGVLTDAEAKLWELVIAIHGVQTRFNRPVVVNGSGPNANANSGINGINGSAGGAGAGFGGVNGMASGNQLNLAEPIQAIVQKMMEVDDIAARVPTMIPRQAVEDLDNTHHPGHVLKERIEAVSLENAFLNGKIAAISSFRDLLGDALADAFPELSGLRSHPPAGANRATSVPATAPHNSSTPVMIKQEEH